MRTPGVTIDEMRVLLDVQQIKDTVSAKIIISKASDAPPIGSDAVSIVLEIADGTLLTPVSSPAPGFLPEAHTRGATASGRFTFNVPPAAELHRAIVFLCGRWAEFSLGRDADLELPVTPERAR